MISVDAHDPHPLFGSKIAQNSAVSRVDPPLEVETVEEFLLVTRGAPCGADQRVNIDVDQPGGQRERGIECGNEVGIGFDRLIGERGEQIAITDDPRTAQAPADSVIASEEVFVAIGGKEVGKRIGFEELLAAQRGAYQAPDRSVARFGGCPYRLTGALHRLLQQPRLSCRSRAVQSFKYNKTIQYFAHGMLPRCCSVLFFRFAL